MKWLTILCLRDSFKCLYCVIAVVRFVKVLELCSCVCVSSSCLFDYRYCLAGCVVESRCVFVRASMSSAVFCHTGSHVMTFRWEILMYFHILTGRWEAVTYSNIVTVRWEIVTYSYIMTVSWEVVTYFYIMTVSWESVTYSHIMTVKWEVVTYFHIVTVRWEAVTYSHIVTVR